MNLIIMKKNTSKESQCLYKDVEIHLFFYNILKKEHSFPCSFIFYDNNLLFLHIDYAI